LVRYLTFYKVVCQYRQYYVTVCLTAVITKLYISQMNNMHLSNMTTVIMHFYWEILLCFLWPKLRKLFVNEAHFWYVFCTWPL